ncbi:MAG: redoxin domain-containing protein [Saprospiraceae bacterium]|nr:redoxin domain-containing protein [Saprospiraceae bacterium]
MIQLAFYILLLTPFREAQGTSRLPDDVLGDSLTVYIFLHDECVISQFFTPELSRLFEKYRSKGVGFIGYFPNPAASPEKMSGFAEAYHLDFPMLRDQDKALARKFGVTITPEVAVWDHKNDQLIYRGRIDDSYVRVGKRKLHPQHFDLEETIEGWLLNPAPMALSQTQAIGCFINFTD